jgi:hypothetical protein
MIIALLLAIGTACTATILWGVYLDHIRRRRQARLTSTYRTAAANRQTCRDSLRVIGGACSDGRRP